PPRRAIDRQRPAARRGRPPRRRGRPRRPGTAPGAVTERGGRRGGLPPQPHEEPSMLPLLAALALAAPADAPRRPPNFVVVFTDDQGYGDLGCQGGKHVRTPNIDRLAREGTRFTDFYVAQAVCSASRTALLTGCYPNRVGILGALGPA